MKESQAADPVAYPSITLRPIQELRPEHQGRVALLDVKQWAGKGQWGRVWGANEGKEGRGGTNQIQWLIWVGFTHFVELAELHHFELHYTEMNYGSPATEAEQKWMAEKYAVHL